MVTTRIRGGTGTNLNRSDPIRSSGDLPDQTAEEPSDPPTPDRSNHVAQEPSDPPAPHRSNHVAQERSDPPAPHRSNHVAQETSDPPAPHRSNHVAQETSDPPVPHRSNHVAELVDVGPWGGDGGSSWDDGVYDGVRQIKICAGQCIDSITVVYDKNGQSVSAERHGGGGGSPYEFTLRYPEEYLVHVSGHYAPYFNGLANPIIRSLKFKTNKGASYGPYGTKTGKSFNLPIQRARIVGFMGRSGLALDNIAFHISLN